MEQVIRQLQQAKFSVTLGLDHGEFQNLVLACWPTIIDSMRHEAERRKRFSVVEKVNQT